MERFTQPAFSEETLKALASELQLRWKYDHRYGTAHFDEWEAAFTIGVSDRRTQELFSAYDLNPASPYHWRALLEAFIGEFMKFKGRPNEQSPEKFFAFALDVIEMLEEHGAVKRDSQSAIVDALQRFEPYAKRHRDRNERTLRKLVAGVLEILGPIDESSLKRLAELDAAIFSKVYFERKGLTDKLLSRECD